MGIVEKVLKARNIELARLHAHLNQSLQSNIVLQGGLGALHQNFFFTSGVANCAF